MAQGVAGTDQIVAEGGVDEAGEGLPKGVGADFGRGSLDSGDSKRLLDRSPSGGAGKAGAGLAAGKEKGAGTAVGESCYVILKG